MSTPRIPCSRCGQKRAFRSGRGNLCRDCRDTMTEHEVDNWLLPETTNKKGYAVAR